jgi:hypothetical protein
MCLDEIEGIACHCPSRITGIAGSEAGVVVGNIFSLSAELIHVSDIGDVPDVRNTGIHPVVESRNGRGVEECRCTYSVEVVDNQDFLGVG